MLARGGDDPVGGDHHAEVEDLEVIALEHDAHDVLADVVHVPLHGGEHDPSCRLALPAQPLLGFDEGDQVGHRLLHHPGAFYHLGEEHLPRAEEVADDAHPRHQRPFDHVERAGRDETRLLGVGHHEFVEPMHQGVGEPLLHRLAAPLGGALLSCDAGAHPRRVG